MKWLWHIPLDCLPKQHSENKSIFGETNIITIKAITTIINNNIEMSNTKTAELEKYI